jgi:hypothetical protein
VSQHHDIDENSDLENGMKAIADRFTPRPNLERMVDYRIRRRSRSRGIARVSVATAVVAIAAASLFWVRSDSSRELSSSGAPSLSGVAGPVYPELDGADVRDVLPGVDLVAGVAKADNGVNWWGTIGALTPDGTPTSVVVINAGPGASSAPDAVPGRRPGITESRQDHAVALHVEAGADGPLALFGGDLDTLYDLVDHLRPTADGPRPGYEIVGELPDSLVELTPPRPRSTIDHPTLSDDSDGSVLSVGVVGETPAFSALACSMTTPPLTVTVGARFPGIAATCGQTQIVVWTVSDSDSLTISSQRLSREELVDVAGRVRLVDKTEWEEHYGP